jgi:hypothetical protein
MITMGADRHSTDGDLISLLDGERGTHQRAVEAHVDGCSECSGRLAQLQQRSARLSAALHAVEPPMIHRSRLLPPERSSTRPLLRRGTRAGWSHPSVRAAAAVLLLAGVAAASPARAWILDRIAGRRSESRVREPNMAPPPAMPAPPHTATSIVRFVTESDDLVVRFAVRPAAGALVIAGGQEPRSSAQIVSGARGEAFLVLPDELRIRNTVGSVADYQIVLAPTVRRVRVRVGDAAGSEIATIDVAPGTRQTIALAQPRGETR